MQRSFLSGRPVLTGLLFGLVFGGAFALYSTLSTCHPTPLGGTGGCSCSVEIYLGLFEFFLYFPLIQLLALFGVPLSMYSFSVLLIVAPLLFFTLIGILAGILIKNTKRARTPRSRTPHTRSGHR